VHASRHDGWDNDEPAEDEMPKKHKLVGMLLNKLPSLVFENANTKEIERVEAEKH